MSTIHKNDAVGGNPHKNGKSLSTWRTGVIAEPFPMKYYFSIHVLQFSRLNGTFTSLCWIVYVKMSNPPLKNQS